MLDFEVFEQAFRDGKNEWLKQNGLDESVKAAAAAAAAAVAGGEEGEEEEEEEEGGDDGGCFSLDAMADAGADSGGTAASGGGSSSGGGGGGGTTAGGSGGGQWCKTCRSSTDLEEDEDSRGDYYCGPCWDALEEEGGGAEDLSVEMLDLYDQEQQQFQRRFPKVRHAYMLHASPIHASCITHTRFMHHPYTLHAFLHSLAGQYLYMLIIIYTC